MSFLIVAGRFLYIYWLFIVQADLPENAFQLLDVMFGALSIAFGQVCNYWFGSSAGSKRAGDSVRKIVEQSKKIGPSSRATSAISAAKSSRGMFRFGGDRHALANPGIS